mmetsp:Transcript_13761/g.60087  ORF Transcript_13761/g.60087 Transcript_13761/m.60087 type:complete len:279 (+) Transcript_13761:916-1752(+)
MNTRGGRRGVARARVHPVAGNEDPPVAREGGVRPRDVRRPARIPRLDHAVPVKHRRDGVYVVGIRRRESLAVARQRHRREPAVVPVTQDAMTHSHPGPVDRAPPEHLDVPAVRDGIVGIRDAHRDCPAVAGHARSRRRVLEVAARDGLAHPVPPQGGAIPSIDGRETRARRHHGRGRHHQTRAVVGQRYRFAEALAAVDASEVLPHLGPKAVSPLVHSNKPSRCVVLGGVVLVDGRHRHARAVQGQRNVVSHMSAHVADELASNGDPIQRVALIDGHV